MLYASTCKLISVLTRSMVLVKKWVAPSELFWRLGIAGRMESKSRMIPAAQFADAVAHGEAEIGIQQIVELLPVKGVTVVGSLPAEVQRYTVFSGGIATNAKNPAGAEALIHFLSSPDAAPAISRTGLEPLSATPAK